MYLPTYLPRYTHATYIHENGAKSITCGHVETYIVASCSARVLRAVVEECDYIIVYEYYSCVHILAYSYIRTCKHEYINSTPYILWQGGGGGLTSIIRDRCTKRPI